MGIRTERKTLIGVLASSDHVETNNRLARVLDRLCSEEPNVRRRIEPFHFLITGGTFDRIIAASQAAAANAAVPVSDVTREFLRSHATVLPSGLEGGVTILSYFVTQRQCSIVWPFFSPRTNHWLAPENLALMRLCDQWRVKRLMNTGSVDEWFSREAEQDAFRNVQECPPKLVFCETNRTWRAEEVPEMGTTGQATIRRPYRLTMPATHEETTIALIAHDEMKPRMVEFAVDNEQVLARFGRILTTGTTGREVADATSHLAPKIYRYHSGPKGGDIEIATEILFGRCHVVVFFTDPLHPHPHIEDIRVVFAACMIQDDVRMITNEMQAREWIERVAKRM